MTADQHGIGALRERLAGGAEDRLGRALTDLLDSPVVNGAIGRAFDAREKAAQAQELAMGALNLPSAADIERLTRRLRSLSQRLEGIEDGVSRFDRSTGQRLAAIEDQLKTIAAKVETIAGAVPAAKAPLAHATTKKSEKKRESESAAAGSSGAAASRPASAAKPSARRAGGVQGKPGTSRPRAPRGGSRT